MKIQHIFSTFAILALLSTSASAETLAGKAEKSPLPKAPAEIIHNHGDTSTDKAVNEASQTESTKAFKKATGEMHSKMIIAYTGDADIDFVRGMIPHHQGAIDMAKVVLQYGKDAEVKKLAQDIIVAQEKEIAQMKSWLKSHDKNPAKAN
jgi:uncharacterized protein (DUF305 family)